MVSKDYLLKAIDNAKQIRLTIVSTTAVVQEMHERHQTSATASAALGRVLTAALIMGTDLKGKNHILTIRVDGNGIAGPIIATVDSAGNGRGTIYNPAADLPSKSPGKLDVGKLVGTDGYLEVIKDMGMKQPFIGRVPIVSGEIAEDLTSYYLLSEQIPSLVSLGVLVAPDLNIRSAGGLIVQAMPGADDSLLELIENNVLAMGSISDIINSSENLEDIVASIMEGLNYSIIDKRPVQFKCTCNHERLAMILASLSLEEINEIYSANGKLEVTCNFCSEVYQYSVDEIVGLKSKKP
ncbi:MAG: Hsp33 family molecular chaperone HslO [Syntrophomonadaceae bacterium]|nr:Hsp33 family molecular chaperone HslO [Syntrophomonadaceae bacterium]MDD3888472.1 Hsp33 family molecular chaperone HslO [Syntrophomonadaceae bacterium]